MRSTVEKTVPTSIVPDKDNAGIPAPQKDNGAAYRQLKSAPILQVIQNHHCWLSQNFDLLFWILITRLLCLLNLELTLWFLYDIYSISSKNIRRKDLQVHVHVCTITYSIMYAYHKIKYLHLKFTHVVHVHVHVHKHAQVHVHAHIDSLHFNLLWYLILIMTIINYSALICMYM